MKWQLISAQGYALERIKQLKQGLMTQNIFNDKRHEVAA